MDAFFASVEAHDDPSLRGKPLIVGGSGSRGVVASCSYEARVHGVRSAMPATQARRLCPHAIFVAGRYERYSEVSREMHAIFNRFTPRVEGISLDEAFLDVTGSTRLLGPPERIGREIRSQVKDELGLDCSVGGATVKFLAKLASEAAKPRVGPAGRTDGAGVVIIGEGQELAFLHPHPIEALWGVGPATARRLRELGLATIADLARIPPPALESAVGRAAGRHLAALSRGIDERDVVVDRDPKSISHEETYAADRWDRDGLQLEILRMADSVGTRLRRAGLVGRTVTIKIRYGDFSTHTRSATLASATDEAAEIAGAGTALLAGCRLEPGVRLLGVGVTNLGPPHPGAEQLTLDLPAPTGPESDPSATGLDRPSAAGRRRPPATGLRPSATPAVDAIRDRFGTDAIGPASLVRPGGDRARDGSAAAVPPAPSPKRRPRAR